MTTPFYLIDFENVQPRALDRLKPGTARIKVFLGQHQSKLMLELVQALQPFGRDAEYIQIQGSGPDAVDFHIAFYIGRLAAAHPGAAFTIISKDKGFDPLVKHLATLGIGCKRLAEIPGTASASVAAPAKPKASPPAAAKAKVAKTLIVTVLPEPNGTAAAPAKAPIAKATTARARTSQVVAWLQKTSKPARLATLRTSIKARFNLDDKAADALILGLQGSRKIAVAGTKVTYMLG